MSVREALLTLCFLVSLSFQNAVNTEKEGDLSDIVPVPYDSNLAETLVRGGGGGSSFTYDYSKVKGIGPALWKYVYPEHCAEKRQSPVDLKGAKKMNYAPFKFMGYSKKPMKMEMKNNGHTAVVTLEMDPMPMITGGGLEGKYEFKQMHWHWGSNPKKGSEHKVNGKAYPLELHLVHFKKEYHNISEALHHDDGLAVLGTFLKTGSRIKRKSPYKEVHRKLKGIKKYDSMVKMNPKKLFDFLPTNKKNFYRYDGSLTTPTCNPVVIWTVFKEAPKIKKYWLKKFTQLKTNLNTKMVNNYRPPQPLKGRTIYMT